MFGYIKPCKAELRIKEYELYRAFYCSMCKELGKSYGPFARFTLNYEFVFLALLCASLNEKECPTKLGRCPFNPAKKCNYCTAAKSEFEFAGAAAVMLLYYKLLDNLRDEKGIKKLGYSLIKPEVFKNYRKAKQKYPELDELFKQYDIAQQAAETQYKDNIDAAAEPTAKMLAGLFKMCTDDETQHRVLERLGYCIGRYIYVMDAAMDIEKDIKSGSYNPLKNNKDALQIAKRQINFSVNEAAAALELLKIYKFKNILGNIITLGLEQTFNNNIKES